MIISRNQLIYVIFYYSKCCINLKNLNNLFYIPNFFNILSMQSLCFYIADENKKRRNVILIIL